MGKNMKTFSWKQTRKHLKNYGVAVMSPKNLYEISSMPGGFTNCGSTDQGGVMVSLWNLISVFLNVSTTIVVSLKMKWNLGRNPSEDPYIHK